MQNLILAYDAILQFDTFKEMKDYINSNKSKFKYHYEFFEKLIMFVNFIDRTKFPIVDRYEARKIAFEAGQVDNAEENTTKTYIYMTKEELLKLTKKTYIRTIKNYLNYKCNNCNDCSNCDDCTNCYDSNKLRKQKYYINNIQLTKEEYEYFMNN